MTDRDRIRDDTCPRIVTTVRGWSFVGRPDRARYRGNRCDALEVAVDELRQVPGSVLPPDDTPSAVPPVLALANAGLTWSCEEQYPGSGRVGATVETEAGVIVEVWDWRSIPGIDSSRLTWIAGQDETFRTQVLATVALPEAEAVPVLRQQYRLKKAQAESVYRELNAVIDQIRASELQSTLSVLDCYWVNTAQTYDCPQPGGRVAVSPNTATVLAGVVRSYTGQDDADQQALAMATGQVRCLYPNLEQTVTCEDLGFVEPVPGDETTGQRGTAVTGADTVRDLDPELADARARDLALLELRCFYVNDEYANSCDELYPRGVRITEAGTSGVRGFYGSDGDSYIKDGYTASPNGSFVQFDGVDDYAQVPSNEAMNIAGVTRVLRVTFRSPPVQPVGNQALVGRGGWHSGWGLIYQPNNRVLFLAKQAASSTVNYYMSTLNVTLTLNTWYTVEVTIENAGVTSASINGTPVGLIVAADRVGTYGDAAVPLQIARGLNLSSPLWYLNGALAHVLMSDTLGTPVFEYSMSERTGSMVGAQLRDIGPLGLHGTYLGGTGNPDSPVSRWVLRDDSGDTLYLSNTNQPDILDGTWQAIYGDTPVPVVTDAGTEGDVATVPGTNTPGQTVVIPAGFVESFESVSDANEKAEALGLSLLDCYWVNDEYTATCPTAVLDSGQSIPPSQEQTEAFGGPLAFTNIVDRGAFQSRDSKADAQEQAEVYAEAQLLCVYCNLDIAAACTEVYEGVSSLDRTRAIAAGSFCSTSADVAQLQADVVAAIPERNLVPDAGICRYGNKRVVAACWDVPLQVRVAGAGTEQVNGLYTQDGDNMLFTAENGAEIYLDDTDWAIGWGGGQQYLGTSTTWPWEAEWGVVGGLAPAPTVTVVDSPTHWKYDYETGRTLSGESKGARAVLPPNTFVVEDGSEPDGQSSPQEYADSLAVTLALLALDCYWVNAPETVTCAGVLDVDGNFPDTNRVSVRVGSAPSESIHLKYLEFPTNSGSHRAVFRVGTSTETLPGGSSHWSVPAGTTAAGLAAIIRNAMSAVSGMSVSGSGTQVYASTSFEPGYRIRTNVAELSTKFEYTYTTPDHPRALTAITVAEGMFMSYESLEDAQAQAEVFGRGYLRCIWGNDLIPGGYRSGTGQGIGADVGVGGTDVASVCGSGRGAWNNPGVDANTVDSSSGKTEANALAQRLGDASVGCDWSVLFDEMEEECEHPFQVAQSDKYSGLSREIRICRGHVEYLCFGATGTVLNQGEVWLNASIGSTSGSMPEVYKFTPSTSGTIHIMARVLVKGYPAGSPTAYYLEKGTPPGGHAQLFATEALPEAFPSSLAPGRGGVLFAPIATVVVDASEGITSIYQQQFENIRI